MIELKYTPEHNDPENPLHGVTYYVYDEFWDLPALEEVLTSFLRITGHNHLTVKLEAGNV